MENEEEGVCPENEKSLMMNSTEGKDCSACKGNCCRYVITEIDKPESLEDFEEIKWFVAHKNVNVFVDEDGTWNLEFLTPCEFLGEDNLCKIYEKRPEICREFSVDECPHHNEYAEKHTFNCLKDVEDYIENVWKK
jgi:Fe-S-cluster containining protein